ncbi:hypothetical protein ACP70R_004582 [Stipagrostis hirtigluma subsp. patula]
MNNMELPSGILTFTLQKKADSGDDSEAAAPVVSEDSTVDGIVFTKPGNAFRVLFSRSLVRSTLVLWFVYIAYCIAYYGIVLLTSELSNAERRCAYVGIHLRLEKDDRLYKDILLTSFAALLVDRIGRKVLNGVMVLLCCGFIALLAVP